MHRRDLLKSAVAAPLLTATGTLFAAPAAQSRFLVVFLRGGYDAASLLVPISSSFYYEVRPNIGIARPSPAADSTVPVDSDWGLHPSLRDTIGPMLARREAAFVPFSGTEDLSRSHFETQDTVELGQPVGGRRDFRSGFMNRLAAVLQGCAPISFTDQLPLSFQGQSQVPNILLRSVGKAALDARQSSIIASMYGGTDLAATVGEAFAVRDEVAREMGGEMEAASRSAMSAKGFELEARRIGKLMQERYTLGFVDVGGWNTHVGQGAATGYLPSRLEELGRGLSGFASEMGSRWRDTTVVVLSEFGRTFRENGNRGTDHGHGSVMWVLGGAAKAAPVVGERTALTANTLFQNRDWPVLNDYRGVMAGLFADQFALREPDLQRVFPLATPLRLQLT